MSFTAIVTSHANEPGLRRILGNLRYQTRPPDETIALCSDTPDFPRLREHFPDVKFLRRKNRMDFGHEKRAEGVELATQEWLGFFNDDDTYDNTYIEKMLAASDGKTAVYCGWNESPHCAFMLGSSTSGNFIVATGLAQRVGYRHRSYEADGLFIEDLVRAGAQIVFVNEVLYLHNH